MKNSKTRFTKEFGKKIYTKIFNETNLIKKQEHADWLGVSGTRYSHYINGTGKITNNDFSVLEKIFSKEELIENLI